MMFVVAVWPQYQRWIACTCCTWYTLHLCTLPLCTLPLHCTCTRCICASCACARCPCTCCPCARCPYARCTGMRCPNPHFSCLWWLEGCELSPCFGLFASNSHWMPSNHCTRWYRRARGTGQVRCSDIEFLLCEIVYKIEWAPTLCHYGGVECEMYLFGGIVWGFVST